MRIHFRLACIDLSATRRAHLQAVLEILPPSARGADLGLVSTVTSEDAERWSQEDGSLGCHAVIGASICLSSSSLLLKLIHDHYRPDRRQ